MTGHPADQILSKMVMFHYHHWPKTPYPRVERMRHPMSTTRASVAGGMTSAEYNSELRNVNNKIWYATHHDRLTQEERDRQLRAYQLERRTLYLLRDEVIRGRHFTQVQ